MNVYLIETMGNDLTVVNAARVSYGMRSYELTERDINLINYLARNGHNSPFYHPQATLHVEAPIYVARQLMRHHVGLTVNEVSRRYTRDTPYFEWPRVWRAPDPKNRQSSTTALSTARQREADAIVSELAERIGTAYADLLELGVAPELARTVLPMSTVTRWYWTGSLYAFFNVWRERTEPNAQTEAREVADLIQRCLEPRFAHSWEALAKYQNNRSG